MAVRIVTFEGGRRAFRAPPVGRCIYCGKAPPAAVLSREHVIPIGIGDGLILPNASCEECRKLTAAFETATMRTGHLKDFRVKSKMVRHKSERPAHLPIKDPRTPTGVKYIPIEDYPHVLHAPRFPEPHFFSGRDIGHHNIEYRMETFGHPDRIQEIADFHGGTITLNVTVNLLPFMQMLAKIAHGLIWNEMGPENFRPYLTELIRGESKHSPNYYIGETDKAVENLPYLLQNDLHAAVFALLEWKDKWLVEVRLTLFKRYAAPTYFIVVGELTASNAWLAERGLRRDGAKIARVSS